MYVKSLGVFALLSVQSLFGSGLTLAEERPNVVVVLVDDFGWGDPACQGNPLQSTPGLDRMAREGTRFTQGYVASPICSPSRCGLLTGQFPARWKITSYLQTRAGNTACEMADFLARQAPTIPRMLKHSGYTTAHIGKWHLGGGRDVENAPKFADYGYDLGIGTWESPEPHPDLTSTNWVWAASDKVKRHERTAWMIDRTLDFVRKRRDKPAFVNLWLDDTHTPFVPSPEQMAAVKVQGEGEQKTKYKAVLAEFDRQLSRLLDGLRETNTLVVLLGDNGPSPPFERDRTGGLRGQKLSLYEGGVRVPWFVWWPRRVPAGRVDETSVVSSVDLLPTLARLCSAGIPEDVTPDGIDVSAAFLGETIARDKPLYWEYGRNETSFAYPMDERHRSPNVAVRDGNWKLLVRSNGEGIELYDLGTDREEAKNIAEERPEVAERLKGETLAWKRALP
jgi:arylsulfatase A-like enzyme